MTIRPHGLRAFEILLYLTWGCASVVLLTYYLYLTGDKEYIIAALLAVFVIYCWTGIISSYAHISNGRLKLKIVRRNTFSCSDLIRIRIWNSGKGGTGVPSLLIESPEKRVYFPASLYSKLDLRKLIDTLTRQNPELNVAEEVYQWLDGRTPDAFNHFRLVAGGGTLFFLTITVIMVLTAT